MEKTLVLLKPDAIEAKHVGDIIKHYENQGLAILALKMLKMTKDLAKKHYAEHVGRSYYEELENFMTQSPTIALVLAGENAIEKVRELHGATDPKEAAKGTIRELYAKDKGQNAVHASDSVENAQREIHIFFNETEIFD